MGMKHERVSETFEMENGGKTFADQNAFHVQIFQRNRLPETTFHKVSIGQYKVIESNITVLIGVSKNYSYSKSFKA